MNDGDELGLGRTLRVAEDVAATLRARGVDTVVIGAMALAVHGYPRDTGDLDLAVAVDPTVLHELAADLIARGYAVVVRDPDAQDPLGGVVDISRDDADLVQVINFLNPPSGGFPRLVADAVVTATALVPGGSLKVVDVYGLVAFKLYAGGSKSRLDILELIERNPALDLGRLRALCDAYGLREELEETLPPGP